ncbi:MAG: ribonuclease HII [Gammaproteobacteria bacterium RIFCSPHIGHO2_12_FULL_37_34]|nr:MAG: ribonuclease HII [Gammaproteobacteria bacterium RIFCSPHIGHO2_12_FULL_37_34]
MKFARAKQYPDDILISGVDEAGRGPLAGPVVAAAVILNPSHPIDGLKDSKQLSASQRCILFSQIRKHTLAWAVASASVTEIDELNILQATLLAMQRAVTKLKISPKRILVDGNQCPTFPCEAKAIIRGDDSVPAISAASIVAKVVRDRWMVMLDKHYPAYGFAQHKGYTTLQHIKALRLHGPCRIHRKYFARVSEYT